jgi:hypothetical protein
VQSSASSAEKVGSVGYLANECGWKVRRLVETADEMRMVAQVQAEAFHVPVALFNDFFFQFFQVSPLFFSSLNLHFNFVLNFSLLPFLFVWIIPFSSLTMANGTCQI